MSPTEITVLVVVLLVLALVAVIALVLARQRKSKALRSQFGPEYDRAVEDSGGRSAAERELAERAQRRQQLDIRPLSDQDRRAFSDRWRSAQEDFVDRPSMAVRSADVLVAEVMGKRGYPVGDFDQQARDVSVDHADVVQEYRTAHEISELNDREQATTEQLRQAMVHYRSLFSALVEDGGSAGDDRSTGDARSHADGARGAGDVRTSDRTGTDRGHVTDQDRPQTERSDDHTVTRSVVDGGLVRPGGDGPADGAYDDRSGDGRPLR